MLTRQQKEALVEQVTEEITHSKSVVISDFKGVEANDMVKLKKLLDQAGGNYRVIKKTLLNHALKQSGIEFNARSLEGQLGISISNDDEVSVPKILSTFAKENEQLEILGGFLGKDVLDQNAVKNLANLPGKDELRAKLVGTMNGPVSGFVNVLAGNLRGLVTVLKAVSEKKAEVN